LSTKYVPKLHVGLVGFVSRTNSTISIAFLIVNYYVPQLHVGLVGFVSLGTAAWVQLDRSNREASKTSSGHPVL
jgi:hypothetical protein